MKVIAVDNFNREYVSDFLIKENVTKEDGEKIVGDYYNNKISEYSSWFYKLVEDDYKLHVFNPNG